MTIQEFLSCATTSLNRAGIATARLDVLVIMEDELGRSRAQLLAHLDDEIPPETEVELNNKIVQRARHTPLAYIRGKAEFYGREFAVNEHVLVPRPETEVMIDELKAAIQKNTPSTQLTIVDLGTGSGAIAITTKLEIPQAKVIATDIDANALNVARRNAKKHGVNIMFIQGDLLAPLPTDQQPTIILANLPYVPERYGINPAAEHEPKHAIFSGKDGLNLYRKFWEQIAALPRQPLLVLTESLPTQHDDMLGIARRAGFELVRSQDFIQVFRPAPTS